MKVKLIGFMAILCLVCAANTFAALDCKDWLGTWDVELTDGTTTVWEVDEVGTPSFPQDCKVTGTSTPEQGDPFPFQIMVISFAKTKFYYTEEMVITQSSPTQELVMNEAKDGFEAATSGDYPLIGTGAKRTEEPETGECTSIDPLSSLPGETADVAITVKNATLGTGANVAFDCSEITVNSTSVDSATQISVNITVADDAAEKTCAITVNTPDQAITQGCSFTIGAAPACTDADNDTYGQNCPAGADCDDNNTDVNPVAEELCDDGIDNNCDGQIDEGCIPECIIESISPASVNIGFGLLPRLQRITITVSVDLEELGITGEDLAFDALSGITILDVPTVSGDTVTAWVLFWGVQPGAYNVSLGGECTPITFTIERFF
jgi:hypothetical protein